MRINFVGDLSMVAIDPNKFKVSTEIQKRFKGEDINVANLECPLTDCETMSKFETWHMKGKPEKNYILDMFDVFSLANNHVLDYSGIGLKDTIDFLDKDGKLHFGAGMDEQSANKPLLIERDSIKLAFLGLTRWYNAKGDSFGTATDNIKTLSKQIKKLKKDGYFVILMPHWNYVHIDYPSPYERTRGRKLIKAGADLIVGAHPHTLHGEEEYRGKRIFHSLGNFIFHTNSQYHKFSKDDIRNRETYILHVDIDKNQNYSVDYTYVYNDNNGVRLMTAVEKKMTIERVDSLSKAFITKEYKKLFYSKSHIIVNKTMAALKTANDLSGSKTSLFFDRIKRIRKQDIAIKLHSMLNK